MDVNPPGLPEKSKRRPHKRRRIVPSDRSGFVRFEPGKERRKGGKEMSSLGADGRKKRKLSQLEEFLLCRAAETARPLGGEKIVLEGKKGDIFGLQKGELRPSARQGKGEVYLQDEGHGTGGKEKSTAQWRGYPEGGKEGGEKGLRSGADRQRSMWLS